MKLTSSQEEYLKTIYILSKNNEKVRVTDIAQKLGITKPSVNKAVNILRDLELINYETYGNVTLTETGENVAKDIIKRYDILKMFLVDIIDVEESQAEEEAKVMKHAMSKDTTKKLYQYISKVMNLGDLECGFDEDNEKCRNCARVRAKKELEKNNKR